MQREEGPRERAKEHRRRTVRAERHATTEAIHTLEGEDLDASVPLKAKHDVGHKTSPPVKTPKPGRRRGFKVWKTSFWKRRKNIRREKALQERIIAEEE